LLRIVFFGDSICYGEKVSPNKTFVVRIAQAISEEYGDCCYVDNPSISGNTTRMALERMPQAVQKLGVDLIVIQFGLNDCNYWETDHGAPRVNPQSFRWNLQEIMDRSRIFGAKRIILNTNHPTLRTERFSYCPQRYEDGNKKYNSVIRRVASANADCILVDMEKEFRIRIEDGVQLADLLLEDQLHLSEKGHDIYYCVLEPIILSVLKELLN